MAPLSPCAPSVQALIRGHLTDAGWRASGLWTDSYLMQRAVGARESLGRHQ